MYRGLVLFKQPQMVYWWSSHGFLEGFPETLLMSGHLLQNWRCRFLLTQRTTRSSNDARDLSKKNMMHSAPSTATKKNARGLKRLFISWVYESTNILETGVTDIYWFKKKPPKIISKTLSSPVCYWYHQGCGKRKHNVKTWLNKKANATTNKR